MYLTYFNFGRPLSVKNEVRNIEKFFYVKFNIGLALKSLYKNHARLSDDARLSILPMSSITLFRKYLCVITYHIM